MPLRSASLEALSPHAQKVWFAERSTDLAIHSRCLLLDRRRCSFSQNFPLKVLSEAFKDADPATPIYFILSPGANVTADVDKLADKHHMERGVTYHDISLGQVTMSYYLSVEKHDENWMFCRQEEHHPDRAAEQRKTVQSVRYREV